MPKSRSNFTDTNKYEFLASRTVRWNIFSGPIRSMVHGGFAPKPGRQAAYCHSPKADMILNSPMRLKSDGLVRGVGPVPEASASNIRYVMAGQASQPLNEPTARKSLAINLLWLRDHGYLATITTHVSLLAPNHNVVQDGLMTGQASSRFHTPAAERAADLAQQKKTRAVLWGGALVRASCRLLFCLPVLMAIACAGAHAQSNDMSLQGGIATPLWSQPNANEVDTAANLGGQAGGLQLGRDYRLETLRCPPAAAIVGMQIRRGDVLDYLQIACAAPNCVSDVCTWSAATMQWGPSAGSDMGGDTQQPMLCNQNSALIGFSARVVTFTVFDYAADIAPQCGQLASAPSSVGFYAITTTAPAARAGVSVENSYTPPNATNMSIVGPTSCAPNGAATAVSVATAAFVAPGQRVVQAVSLYCPAQPVPIPCVVNVAFEGLAAGIGPAHAMHAVVVLTAPGFQSIAYEANPTGRFPNWGTLVSHKRNLSTSPLKPGVIIKNAGLTPQSCAAIMPQITGLEATINRSTLAYQPAPEVTGGVNSNSFAYWLITQLGLQPPAVNSVTEGPVPGYNNAIH